MRPGGREETRAEESVREGAHILPPPHQPQHVHDNGRRECWKDPEASLDTARAWQKGTRDVKKTEKCFVWHAGLERRGTKREPV